MRVSFVAYGAGAYLEQIPVECGASGTDSDGIDCYVTFQRGTTQEPARGIYFETLFKDCGAWDCVRAVRVARTQISVELEPGTPGLEGIEAVDIELDIDDADFTQFCLGVRAVFQGTAVAVQFD